MDHSENDKRFCVYTHTDLDGNIRYIGSGTEKRSRNKSHRDSHHLEIWDSLVKNIVHSNLTKNEAAKIEEDLILRFWETGLLLNKKKSSLQTKPIRYNEVSRYVYYDETSPTFLRWTTNVNKGYVPHPAGYIYKNGYGTCCINYNEYKIHRLVWVLSNKKDLVDNLVIDHIDRNKHNNKISNLRLVTHQENMSNSSRVLEAEYVSVWWQSRRKFYIMKVIMDDVGNYIHKSVSPHVLFPNEIPDKGKEKVLAIFEEMKNIISAEKAKLGTKFLNEEWIRNNVFSLVKRNKSFNNFNL